MTLTPMQKAIMTEIKKNNTDSAYLNQYNKGIKFEHMSRYIDENYKEYTITSYTDENGENVSMTKYMVECRIKPIHRHGNNIVKYMVNVYSDGTMTVYFDGTDYKA